MRMKKCLILIIIALTFVFSVSMVNASSPGIVSTSRTGLNVRSGPGTSYQRVALLAKGSYVTLISCRGDWWKVEYSPGKYGYCSADYITVADHSKGNVSTDGARLNIRKGPGTNYSIAAQLTNNTPVTIISETGNWYKILYNGVRTGYICKDYVRLFASVTYPSVSLDIPYYSQSDSRWADVEIGSSGKTIAQIGCLTTALAMSESFRQKKVILPDEMEGKMSYTSTGAAYFPAGYTCSTTSDYLSVIYDKLSAGKPVILGAKKSSGGQHWVIITGFKGGDSLDPQLFTINDPGVSARKTLADLFEDYPYYYKVCYY